MNTFARLRSMDAGLTAARPEATTFLWYAGVAS